MLVSACKCVCVCWGKGNVPFLIVGVTKEDKWPMIVVLIGLEKTIQFHLKLLMFLNLTKFNDS